MNKDNSLFPPLNTVKLDWSSVETSMLQFWDEKNIFQELKKQLQSSNKKFSFIDGPITANNPMGVHTARGRTLKDIIQRYWAMRGYNQRFQNGFDTQGLWVEVEVEKSLGLDSKQDIRKLGLDAFVNHCKTRVKKYSKIITNQSRKLGQFMDWDNSYFTHTNQNIEHIWYFLKVCQKNGWIYRSRLVMPWCPRCSTSLSTHEMADSYKIISHPSVYLQLLVKGYTNRFLLVWTTTPWTLTANTALAVNPKFTYLLVKKDGIEYYIAKNSVDVIGSNYRTLASFKGTDLLELEYVAPFSELQLQKGIKHKIVPWEEVSSEEGTGIVHIAPGCGSEDFELGEKFGLGIIAPIDERGYLVKGLEPFSGFTTHEVASHIAVDLSNRGFLFKWNTVKHRYPVCWRCKTELLFKLESEWFISSNEIRPLLQRANETIDWKPSHAGRRMHDWLENMKDWCISRKRYWGLPLPFYPCTCGRTTIVGSLKELRKLAEDPIQIDKLSELHRPWIDNVRIKCPHCGKIVERVPEVGDCWLDAGIVPFSTLKYINDREYWRKWFPADIVCEMIEQIRLWFYSQLFMSVTLEGSAPFKTVVVYEEVRNEDGSPMHKSSGNVIDFDLALKEMGADIMRWSYASQKSEVFLRFGFTVADNIKRKFVPLWNAVRFFTNFAALDIYDISQLSQDSNNVFDQWILARLSRLVKNYHICLVNCDYKKATLFLEDFFKDLTNWYIRSSRRRFWKEKDLTNDKNAAYSTLYRVLLDVSYLLAPFMPFLSEYFFQLLRCPFDKQFPLSVHLCPLPKDDDRFSSDEVLESFKQYQNLVEVGRSLRNKAQVKLRQPLSQALISGDPPFVNSIFKDQFFEFLRQELNVKNLKYIQEMEKAKSQDQEYISQVSNEYNFRLSLSTRLTPMLIKEGLAKEIVRAIQRLRKQSDLDLDAQINVKYKTNSAEITESFRCYEEYIKTETLATKLSNESIKNGIPICINGVMVNLALEVV